ncbi:copper homeostasis protein CutC [Reichenbachiella sp. MALMAid0571]|uniref:copper homeostasis protein CutC n=1 Tax=Reichenbachiella sp. MALMAid0571 TaxID=3143939 RepID=UPI0032E006B6
MEYKLEICANSVQSTINAQKGGADRVELCDNLWEGGTTPSAATIKIVRKNIDIGLFVIIRPRGGDFLYSDLEFEVIKEDIRIAKELGADGIVSGILDADGNIDVARMSELVELSYPLQFTCHRAFDLTSDPFKALEDVISCGAKRILSSGLQNSVPLGRDMLRQLNEKADGRIIIMPGGGVNENNILEIVDETGCKEFHMTGKVVVDGNMKFRNHDLKINGAPQIPEFGIAVSDVGKIRKVRDVLK